MVFILYSLGWLLVLAACVVLACPFVDSTKQFDVVVNGLPAGVLVALGAQLLTQAKNFSDKQENRSLFYLDSCVKAFEEAKLLLQDGNNDRAKWIAAGRALVHARELASNVSRDSHLRVLELHKLKYRRIFNGAISEKPASFFYGVPDASLPINEAAALSTASETRDGRTTASTLKSLPDKALRAVWDASQWPSDYRDPLDRGFSEEEQGKLFVLFPGLHEYLEHKTQWRSMSGELFPTTQVHR